MPPTEHYRVAVETGDEFQKLAHIVVRDSVVRKGMCYMAIDGGSFWNADAIRQCAKALMDAADAMERALAEGDE